MWLRTLFVHRLARAATLALAAAALSPSAASAHELWIETSATGAVGREHPIEICWGHAGHAEGGETLEQQESKLSALAVLPDGTKQPLEPTLSDRCYAAKLVPTDEGFYTTGAALQVGIIDNEFHGIPADTRIVMYAAAATRVGESEEGEDNTLGFDLEIVPVGDPADLRPGDVATVKVLLHGQPIGGREVVVSLGTTGPEGGPDDARIQSPQWTIEGHPDPRTGEVSFPLIAAGKHLFSIRYIDEKPGVYRGDLETSSEFSHLRRGDTFQRTMYVATFSVPVNAR